MVCSGLVGYFVRELAKREAEKRRWLRIFSEWLVEVVALRLLRNLGMLRRSHVQRLN